MLGARRAACADCFSLSLWGLLCQVGVAIHAESSIQIRTSTAEDSLRSTKHIVKVAATSARFKGLVRSEHRGRVQLPKSAEETPLQSCESLRNSSRASSWNSKLWESAEALCADQQKSYLLETYLDRRFRPQYQRIFTEAGGWAPQAYVNYVKVDTKGSYYGKLTEAMVDSVHRFSKNPIVVVNFGQIAPPELDPSRFPRLVLIHARPIPPGKSFNFNKLLAILLARVYVGVSVDSDMMIGPHADKLFDRTRQEVTEAYPWPMLPTHYLDRDPDHRRFKRGNFLAFHCVQCTIKPSLRWGQAQPTWTYWAFPFVGRWLSAKLDNKVEKGVPTAHIGEDEDLLNVALWAEEAKKTWCMFQMMGTSWVWENYLALPQHSPGPEPFYEDPVRFPDGVPIAFYMSHGEHEVDKVYKAMKLLEDAPNHTMELPSLFHKRKFYADFASLRAEHPQIGCIM